MPAQSAKINAPTLVVVLLPGTSLADWQRADAPHLHALMAQGALALMNTRTARTGSDKTRETPTSAVLTLSSSARAAGDDAQGQFLPPEQTVLPSGVTAGQLYQRRMGAVATAGAWVDTDWPRLERADIGRGYDIRLGNLGDALAAQSVSIAAGGGYYALPVACSSAGTVMVAPALTLPPGRPACIVWDAGSDAAAADALLAQAMRLASQTGGRVLALSPFASDADYVRGERLTPVALWGAGVAPGLLYSHATRRAGLVTNTDFAPTVAGMFGASLSALPFGQAWAVRPAAQAGVQVARLQSEAYRQAAGMRILPAFAVVLGLYVLGCSMALFWGRGAPGLTVLPVVSLLALLLSRSVWEWAAWLGTLGIVTMVLMRRAGAAQAVTALCALIVALLAGDLLCGDPLMRRSLLGYSAVEGARYYGIGNEAMGVLIGAALCLAWHLWPAARHRWERAAMAGSLAGLSMLLALPAFGAKAGSVFVALPSFGALLWTLSGRRMGRKPVLALACLAFAAMAGIVLLDSHTGGGQSHVGQAAARIAQGSGKQAWDIIGRKLGVELHLLGHSAWAVPLWGSIVGLMLLAKRRRGGRHWAALRASAAVAGASSLAFNDAGVVACALCLCCVWSTVASVPNKSGPHQHNLC